MTETIEIRTFMLGMKPYVVIELDADGDEMVANIVTGGGIPAEDRVEALLTVLSGLPGGGKMVTEYGVRRGDTGQTIWVGTNKTEAIERSWREVEVVQRLVWHGEVDVLDDESEDR